MSLLSDSYRAFLSQPSPWPEIRKARIEKLLPTAMQLAGVDAWLVACRENNNDPLASHVGGENAGAPAVFMFFLQGDSVESVALSPWGEATALRGLGLHDRVIEFERGESVWPLAAEQLATYNPAKIAVNCSSRGIADGFSWTQRIELEEALGSDMTARLTSAEDLIAEWLSVKLPEEVEIMRRAGELTVALEIEAYGTIIPGQTRDRDVGNYIKKRMAELGVGDSWSPEQNPNVNSGFPRGHSGPTEKVIEPGDFIQTDFGIKVFDVWCTDYQRFAYVLAPGQTEPPPEDLKKWENGRKGSRLVRQAMRPGMRGYDVDKVQRDWMEQTGSRPVKWGTGHPVGYWAHDIGPYLGGGQYDAPPSGDALRLLRPGQTFAYDGFFAWEAEHEGGKADKMISVEEMVVVTEDGAEYLIPPQEDLILIPSR
ncbi:MAG: M24 family metallopeptidase [Anaerolineae bacterium]|jgi:Xaa-Pro aminopeptidase